MPRVTRCLFFLVLRPSCRVYTPLARDQPSSAGPKDRFLRLAQVAAICTPTLAFFSLCVGYFRFFGYFFYVQPLGRPSSPRPFCVSFAVLGPVVFFVSSCFFCTLLPACRHDNAALVVCSCGSSLVSSLILPPPWGFPLGGRRPSQVGALPLPHPLAAPRYPPSPVERLSPFPPYCSSLALCATCCSCLRHGCIFLAHTGLTEGAPSSSW